MDNMDNIVVPLLGLIWLGAVMGLRWRGQRHADADEL
jgi:hypothetical protein